MVDINDMLMKIAIDKARRLFGLGLLGKAVGASPQAAKSAGKMVNEGFGLGEEAIPLGPLKAMRKLNSSLNGVAEARLYRMNRVAGNSRAESVGALALARKRRELELKYVRPAKKVERIVGLKDAHSALNENISGLQGLKEKAKRVGSGLKTSMDIITGKMAF